MKERVLDWITDDDGKLVSLSAERKKRQVNVRLTERGIMKLNELKAEYGFSQSVLVELLITLYHEKTFLLKGGDKHETKGS